MKKFFYCSWYKVARKCSLYPCIYEQQCLKNFINKTIADYNRQLVPGYTKFPPILIGDSAYPLLPNVIKECANCFGNKQIYFNNVLSSPRNQIECAFGRLKSRWRILNRVVDVELNFAHNDLLVLCIPKFLWTT